MLNREKLGGLARKRRELEYYVAGRRWDWDNCRRSWASSNWTRDAREPV